MFSETEVAEFRCDELSRMNDRCSITRPGAATGPMDPITGQYPKPEPVEVYGPTIGPNFGRCRIPKRGADIRAASRNGGSDISWQVGEFPLSLPFDDASARVAPGCTVAYLDARDDPALVGNVYGITEPIDQSLATARRFKMKRVVSEVAG